METYTAEEVQAMMNQAWRRILEFPNAHVCKHYAALHVVSAMPEHLAPPKEIITAIVNSDDETALGWEK